MKSSKKTCSTCTYFTLQRASSSGWGSVMDALGMGSCRCPLQSENPRPGTNLMHPGDSCEHHRSEAPEKCLQ